MSRYKKSAGPIAYPLLRNDDEHDWLAELQRWADGKDWRIEEVIAGPQDVSEGWVQVAVRMAKRGAAA